LFTISGYRRGGVAYLIEALVVLAVISAMIGWSRWRRGRQVVSVGHGVLVLLKWTGQPLVLRTDAVRAVVLTQVKWGQVTPCLLLAVGRDGICLGRVWGAEWDEVALRNAVSQSGIDVVRDVAARSPGKLEAVYPGSTTALERHPIVTGMVVPAVAVVVIGLVLAAISTVRQG
jgi:hypothetical protein